MILLYTTYPDINTARKSIASLLSSRLVACANIFPEMISLYHWEGKVEEAKEVVVIYKTQSQNFEDCRKLISKEHPYSVPCIIQIKVQEADSKYLEWIKKETISSV